MTTILRLIRRDFDSLENRNPHYSKCIKTFIDRPENVAHAQAAAYIAKMASPVLYLGYDGNIYPKFVLEKEYA